MNEQKPAYIPPFYRSRPHIYHNGHFYLTDADGNIVLDGEPQASPSRGELRDYRSFDGETKTLNLPRYIK